MGVLSNGRKISAQFFPRTLIEMPYNKTFGCIIAQKKCSDNIHSVDDTKVGFQKLPRSDLWFPSISHWTHCMRKKNNRGYKVKRIVMAVEVDGHFSPACERSL